MADKLVTIVNFALGSDPALEAELAKIKLKSKGIKCFLAGKNFVATYWLYSNAERGIKLQVRQKDIKRALEILDTRQRADIEQFEEDLKPEAIYPQCPRCLSEDVEYETFSRKLFYLGLLFFRFPIPLLIRIYKCYSCGYCWKEG